MFETNLKQENLNNMLHFPKARLAAGIDNRNHCNIKKKRQVNNQ
jgi:hypothetical protein